MEAPGKMQCAMCNLVVQDHPIGLPTWTCEHCGTRQYALEDGITVIYVSEPYIAPTTPVIEAGSENNRLFCNFFHRGING